MIQELKESLQLSKETVDFLVNKKINNIHTPPNADNLKEVFAFLGIMLASAEKKALDNRNLTLHGNQTMKGISVEEVAAETRQFDILRTLINKATLRLLDYDGPYMDYGNPGTGKPFSVQTLEPRGPSPSAEVKTAVVVPNVPPTSVEGQAKQAEQAHDPIL